MVSHVSVHLVSRDTEELLFQTNFLRMFVLSEELWKI